MKINIEPSALINLVLSAVEKYKKETIGLLIGKREESVFSVKGAFSEQGTHTTYSFSYHNEKFIKKIQEDWTFHQWTIIGDYHSHTQRGQARALPTPSGEDIADMNKYKLYLIIAINENKKYKIWKHSSKIITGKFGKHDIEIAAYILKNGDKSLRVKLLCKDLKNL